MIPRSSIGLASCMNCIKLIENWVIGASLELVAFGIQPSFLVASSTCKWRARKMDYCGSLGKSLTTILLMQKLNDLPSEYPSVKCCCKQELLFCLFLFFTPFHLPQAIMFFLLSDQLINCQVQNSSWNSTFQGNHSCSLGLYLKTSWSKGFACRQFLREVVPRSRSERL